MKTISDTIRVLHVDDEPDFADMTASVLERKNNQLEVETVTSASEGLDRLRNNEFDCIISDYDMPVTNGIEFLRTVRENHPDLPFVLYTGKGSEEVASDAISAGVSDYLQKESGTDQYTLLANRITNLVSQYRAVATVEEYASHREESEQYRQQLIAIVSDTELSETEKMDRLLTLGCDRLGVENGHLVMIDEETNRHEVVSVSGSEVVHEGVTDLSDTYCRKTIQSDGLLDVHHAGEQGWEDDPAYEAFGLECYIGGKLATDDRLFGTLCFVGGNPREPFTHNEKAFFDLLRQWFSHLLDRRRRLKQAETVFEHTQDALFLIDVTDEQRFTLRSGNRAYEELTGYTIADFRGQTLRDRFSDDQAVEIEARFRECIARREPIEYDVQLTVGDSMKHVHTRLAPVVEDDRVVELVGAIRDITDRKEREARLRALNDRTYHLMAADTRERISELGVEAASDVLGFDANAIHLYDEKQAELVPVAGTDAIYDLVGDLAVFTEGDSIAWRVYDNGETLSLDDVHDDPDIYNPETPIKGELYLPLGDHGILIAGSEISATFDQQDVIFGEILAETIAAALDRISREQALKRSEARYRSLTDDVLDTSDVGTFILDASFEVVWINEAIEEYFDIDREAVVGADKRQLIHDYIKHTVEDSEGFATTVLATYDDNTYIEEFGCHVLPTDGRDERWLKHWSQPIDSGPYEGGRIEHYTDITERKHREQELRRQNDRLEEFAGVVSHDLRNPLRVAQGRLELAHEECESEHLDAVATAHDRMSTLIEDLLTLAREGDSVSEQEPLALADVSERCWQNAEIADATIQTPINRTIQADEGRLAQLLENLIRNAVEHGGEGVTVTIGELDDGFYVEDDGPGIPEDEREDVFEAGYSTAEEGTGFGLSIAKQVADAHGWDVRVTDGSDGGARFEIAGVEFVAE